MIAYQDFSIKIELRPDRSYRAVVLRSPAGEGSSPFNLPFETGQIDALIAGLGTGVRSSGSQERKIGSQQGRRQGRRLPGSQEKPQDISQQIGDQLFQALFNGAVRSLFDQSLGMIHGQEKGLRIKIHIDPQDPELAQLASLPWEYLYRKETRDFLTLSRYTPVVRYLDVQRPYIPLPLKPPLRVLVVISAPQDYPALDLQQERRLIEGTWAKLDGIQVDFLEEATIERLQDRMVEIPYHVLHFMGHGGFDEPSGKGVLLLEDEHQHGDPVDGARLGILLRDSPNLRLVILNACESARVARVAGQDPFAGVAAALVLAGIPAVVAMQFPITDQAAITFARRFYDLLVRGTPVDAAVAEGRRAIALESSETLEWGTPVLFMRAPQGEIFQSHPAASPPVMSEAALQTGASLVQPEPLSYTTALPSALPSAGPRVPTPKTLPSSRQGFPRWAQIAGGFAILIIVGVLILKAAGPGPGREWFDGNSERESTPGVLPTMVTTVPVVAQPTLAGPLLTGYYDSQSGQTLDMLVENDTARQIDVLYYAYATIDANLHCTLVSPQVDLQQVYTAGNSVDGQADDASQPLRGALNQLRKLKALYPQIRTLISIGGFDYSANFPQAALEENRQEFVASCLDMFIAGNFAPGILPGISAPGLFDGIDIDWDLPGTETDVLDYVALLAEFRTQLNEIRPGLLLTTASVRDEYRQASLDPRIVLASVDWITVKSFDYWGPWQANISTYHHAPLYTAPGAPTVYSVDYSIQEFLAWGIPADRLTLSVGFYALGWLGVEAPGTNGLLQPAANPSSSYVDLTTLEAWGYPVSYDPIAKAVWSFSGNEFWSFENLETVDAKTRYAMDQQLLGVTIWPLTGEESGELLTTIAEILSGVE